MIRPLTDLCDDCQTAGASLKATLTKENGEVLDSVNLCHGCAATRRFQTGIKELARDMTEPSHFMF